MSAAAPPVVPPLRRWSRPLTVHALVVGAVTLAALVLPGEARVVAELLLALLGTPWAAVVSSYPPSGPAADVLGVLLLVPALVNVAVHWGVLMVVRARRRQRWAVAARVEGAADGRVPQLRTPVVAVLSLVLGAATWAGWLGWDTSYYTLPGTGDQQHGPYRPVQVVLCALTVGLVVAALSVRGNPVVAAAGSTVGFWVVWTLWAAFADTVGASFWPIGSVLLLFGLAAGTAVAALVGYGARVALESRRLSGRTAR